MLTMAGMLLAGALGAVFTVDDAADSGPLLTFDLPPAGFAPGLVVLFQAVYPEIPSALAPGTALVTNAAPLVLRE